jgi:hypothetical protein
MRRIADEFDSTHLWALLGLSAFFFEREGGPQRNDVAPMDREARSDRPRSWRKPLLTPRARERICRYATYMWYESVRISLSVQYGDICGIRLHVLGWCGVRERAQQRVQPGPRVCR